MNYELLMFASKLRKVENLEQLEEMKKNADAIMQREKNYAILTLMTIAEELGDEEVICTIDRLRSHVQNILNK